MSTPEPYWSDGTCSLYLGDMREVLPALGIMADCIIADPPYAETSLAWDRWPDGWLDVAATVTRSLWCFGTLRMYLDRRDEFKAARWKFSQDIIWEKHNGSGFDTDRFKRVHEQPTHWYQGTWGGIYHDTPHTAEAWRTAANSGRTSRPIPATRRPEQGGRRAAHHADRPAVPNMWRRGALHPTEKPVALLNPLYLLPPRAAASS